MAYEMKPESGSLFKNERKEKDTHADYRGECVVDGQAYYMDAWVNTSKNGKKYLSVKFKAKGEKQVEAPAFADDDSDLPF
jgi:uncharacterized protein (DUF736 family)